MDEEGLVIPIDGQDTTIDIRKSDGSTLKGQDWRPNLGYRLHGGFAIKATNCDITFELTKVLPLEAESS